MAEKKSDDKGKASEKLTGARKAIQDDIDRAEAERKLRLLRTRIDLAKTGVHAFTNSKPAESARAFQTYLRVLEDWKGVGEGGIVPGLFDSKLEVAELLLISGVYWDLVKIYDHTKTPAKYKDFLHYMEKFIIFSKGMPFESLCRETVRKYIATEKPRHKADFKNAFKVLGGGTCFVATALLEYTDVETMPRLRRFRGEVLMRSRGGRAFVRGYYRRGPGLARAVERLPEWTQRILGKGLDFMTRCMIKIVPYENFSNSHTSDSRPDVRAFERLRKARDLQQ